MTRCRRCDAREEGDLDDIVLLIGWVVFPVFYLLVAALLGTCGG